MTTIPTKSCKEPGSNTAFPAGPWTGRTLDQSETIVRQYAIAYERKRTAEAEFKQAEFQLKQAHTEGLLEGHFDDQSKTYLFEGVHFKKTSRKSWPLKNFSEQLQTQYQQEKDEGIAKPNINESLAAKWLD